MGLQYYFHQFPDIIAHRGLSQWAPENTLSSFELAANHGISWVETDVRLSRDQVPMVFHDASLERLVGINDLFSSFTCEQLKQFDVGKWFSDDYVNEKIPTLNELLDLAVSKNLGVNIEIKPNIKEDHITVRMIHQLLQHRPNNPPVLFSSYSLDALALCAELRPRVPRAIIVDDFELSTPDEIVILAERLGCTSIHIHHSLLYSPLVAKSFYAPFDLLCFTVNTREIAEACWRAGCVSIFSDNALLNKPNSKTNPIT